MTDPTGTTSNSYDAAGRLTGHTDPNGFAVQYQYDAAGNLTALIYPGNKTVSYGYDTLNRLANVNIGWLNKTESYSYDAAGRHTQASRFNGSQTSYDYDNADRLTQLNHSAASQPLAQYQYTLDANGNRTKAVVTEPKLPEKLINASQTYTYNPQKNRLTNQNSTALTYDFEGQLKTQATINYNYDYAHRLISQGTSSYVYDGIGNRIKATRNGVITKYIYDAAGNLLAEANAGNVITKYYIYGKGLTALVDAATNALYVYHFDGTGHTVALTNASQQTQNTYAYDPYGKLMAQTEAIAQPFKYAGQVGIQAEGNNLYYMRARYYDANLGRFISEDPIGHNGGLNLYAYVGGNPVMAVDPSGLITESEMFALRKIVNIYGWTPVNQNNFKTDPTMEGHTGETNFIGTSTIGTNPADSFQYSGSVIANGQVEFVINTALHENFHSFEGAISGGVLIGWDGILEKFTGGQSSVAQYMADRTMENNQNIVNQFQKMASSYGSSK